MLWRLPLGQRCIDKLRHSTLSRFWCAVCQWRVAKDKTNGNTKKDANFMYEVYWVIENTHTQYLYTGSYMVDIQLLINGNKSPINKSIKLSIKLIFIDKFLCFFFLPAFSSSIRFFEPSFRTFLYSIALYMF